MDYASSELRDRFAAWEVFIGLIFIAVVRFLPDGVAGLVRRRPMVADAVAPLPAPTASRSTGGRIVLDAEVSGVVERRLGMRLPTLYR